MLQPLYSGFSCLLAVSVIEATDSKHSITKYIMRYNTKKVYWVKRKPATILFSKQRLKVKIALWEQK